MTPAAVLFDCDGVVVDSEPMTFDLLADDLAARGLILTHAEMEQQFLGGTIERVGIKARAMGADIPEGWTDLFYEKLYARLAEGMALIADVLQVFDALDAAGIPYAIGSNSTMRKMVIGCWASIRRCAQSGWKGLDLFGPRSEDAEADPDL
ncbi:MAG: HAD family phosphatase [Gemmobacter sp.]|nr:HAD family phosphatase [Gemmobacter sp.]